MLSFKEDLRNRYKDEMKKVVLPPTNSRKDGVLYSFEDIFHRYLNPDAVFDPGIEEVSVGQNEFHAFLEGSDFDAREGQYSKTDKLYPYY